MVNNHWLVVSNMNFIFHIWDVILPIWQTHIFQDGLKPPTRKSDGILWKMLLISHGFTIFSPVPSYIQLPEACYMVLPRCCNLRFQETAMFISAVDTPLPQNAELYRALLLDQGRASTVAGWKISELNGRLNDHLIGGLEHLFSHILGIIIIPTDELHFFQRGRSTTNQFYGKMIELNGIFNLDISKPAQKMGNQLPP